MDKRCLPDWRDENRPCFRPAGAILICASIWGRKWLVSDDFALAANSARPKLVPAPIPTPMLQATALKCRSGRSLAWSRYWLSRLPGRLGQVKTFSALLVFAIYPILATSQELSVHDQVALHAQKARQFLQANQPDLAIPQFRAILVVEPGNVDGLGVLLYFHGDYAGAIPHLQTALKFDPGLWKIQALVKWYGRPEEHRSSTIWLLIAST
jgi:hypothetical protein